MNAQELRRAAAEAHQRAADIVASADTQKRQLTDEEVSQVDACNAEFDRLLAQAEQRDRIEAAGARLAEPQQRRSAPLDPQAQNSGTQPAPAGSGARATHNSTQDVQKWGFKHAGEYYASVRAAYIGRGLDERLIHNAATTWGSEGVGPDGGYAVPPEFRVNIEMLVGSEGSMLSMTDAQVTTSNQLVVPIDETAPWHSSGVRAYWMEEAGAGTQTKPSLKPVAVRANKLGALVYLTDELLEDAAAMGNYVQSKAPLAINWMVNDALVNGNGVAKPLGIVNAPAKVQVAKESSQSAGTIVAANVLKMWSRLLPDSQARAVWLYNVDILPQLLQMNIAFQNAAGSASIAAGAAVYLPPGGLSGNLYATLFGRPMYPTEACQTVGTEGDLVLWDPKGYLTVTKRGGIRQEMSVHVEFEKDLTAFRYILRVGGQPWLSAPVARKNGSNTLSTIVTLQTR